MKPKRAFIWLLLLTLTLTACSGSPVSALSDTQPSSDAGTNDTPAADEASVKKDAPQDINDAALRDNPLLYTEDDTGVVTMYLTVSRGNAAENTDHSWEEINTYSVYDYEDMGVDRYQTAALLQVGDENGPLPGEVGYGETSPNATVQIRGQTSSRNAQKSYKIELKKNKGTWEGQRTINLNKHQSDGLRFRNHLMYRLMQGIPQMLSLRTRFVHLYVKDNTGESEGVFEDYGLYTQVEQLNKTALKAHGLDNNGHLYKINFFEFYRYEDVIVPETDPSYDQKAFDALLETKGNTDHSKLIRMLEDVNDHSIPIDQVLDGHFNRENILYWMAFHILTGNVDTQSRNFYLYSPLNSDTWYIISWDNDAALKTAEYALSDFTGEGSWESGISNYWGNILFQRCLKSEDFRADLDEVITELYAYLSPQRLTQLCERYSQVVLPYLYAMPDAMHAPLTRDEYSRILKALPEEIEENYQLYKESLEKPMPFFIGLPEITDGRLYIHWDPSYDLDAENLTYTVEVARDYLFEDVIAGEEDLLPETSLDVPEPGQYFVRVRAKNASGYVQDAFDYYVTDAGKHFGIRCFYVQMDGTIGEDVYEE